MKKLICALLLSGSIVCYGQPVVLPSPDKSPMDISYFPVDYPIEHMYNRASKPLVARVVYSRPHRQGRKVFGSLLKYGEPWRLGANEATEIEFFRAVEIEGKRINKSRYYSCNSTH